MADRVTRKMVDRLVESLNITGQEYGIEGAGNWIVTNRYGSRGAEQSLLWRDPANGGHTHRTALGEHTWQNNREIVAGLRGLILGLRAASGVELR